MERDKYMLLLKVACREFVQFITSWPGQLKFLDVASEYRNAMFVFSVAFRESLIKDESNCKRFQFIKYLRTETDNN